MVSPNFVKIYLFFIFTYSENFISLVSVDKVWILVSLFEGDLPFGISHKILSNFIFSSYLPILKFSCI